MVIKWNLLYQMEEVWELEALQAKPEFTDGVLIHHLLNIRMEVKGMLVEIKDERILEELMERGVAEEASPLIAYYKDELKCQLEGLKPIYDLNERDINEIVDKLSYGWSDIDFDDVAEQVSIMAKEYIEERVKCHE